MGVGNKFPLTDATLHATEGIFPQLQKLDMLSCRGYMHCSKRLYIVESLPDSTGALAELENISVY